MASEVFKDRPLSPAEEIVYWTEYAIRHNGALHLKSLSLLTIYNYTTADIIPIQFYFVFYVFVLNISQFDVFFLPVFKKNNINNVKQVNKVQQFATQKQNHLSYYYMLHKFIIIVKQIL